MSNFTRFTDCERAQLTFPPLNRKRYEGYSLRWFPFHYQFPLLRRLILRIEIAVSLLLLALKNDAFRLAGLFHSLYLHPLIRANY